MQLKYYLLLGLTAFVGILFCSERGTLSTGYYFFERGGY